MADKINGAKRKFRKYLPILTIGCMVLAGIAIIKFKNGGVKVTTEVAQIRTIAKTISASGETAVLENYVQRALVGGTIKEIKFISGDDVFKGDSILSYDRDSLKSSLDSTYTSYLSAKSDLESYNQKVVSAKATRNIRKQERDEAWRTYMSDNGEDEKQAYKNAEALYQAAISAYVTL
ncbi:MAG: Efflux transporter, partial [candidate division WWE3 bacterium GW2011_GWB1_44_4]